MDKKKQFIKDFKTAYTEGDVSSNAAKISYFLIFAIFPFIITLLNIASFTGLNNQLILDNIASALPTQASEMVLGVINDINKNSSGFLLIFSILLGVWSASRGILSIIQSINEAYELEETRSFIKINLIAVALTAFVFTAIIVSIVLMLFAGYINDALANFLGLDFDTIKLINIVKYVIIVLLLVLVFTMLYRFSPNYETAQPHSIKYSLPGAVFSTVVWLLASFLFSLYINNFANYNKTYGSIGGVIVTLLWMNISASILLLGGVLNATLRRTYFSQDIKTAHKKLVDRKKEIAIAAKAEASRIIDLSINETEQERLNEKQIYKAKRTSKPERRIVDGLEKKWIFHDKINDKN